MVKAGGRAARERVEYSDQEDGELQLLERHVRRHGGDDCAYERALGRLYRRLFEQRRRQLEALYRAGL